MRPFESVDLVQLTGLWCGKDRNRTGTGPGLVGKGSGSSVKALNPLRSFFPAQHRNHGGLLRVFLFAGGQVVGDEKHDRNCAQHPSHGFALICYFNHCFLH